MNDVDQRFNEIFEVMREDNVEFDLHFLTHSIDMFLEESEDDKVRYSELLVLTAHKYLEIYDSDIELFEELYPEGLDTLEKLDDLIEDSLSSFKSIRMSIYRNVITASKFDLFLKYDEYISSCLNSILEFDFDLEIMQVFKKHLENMITDKNDYNDRVIDVIEYCINAIDEEGRKIHLSEDKGQLTIHQIMSYCAGKIAKKNYDDAIICIDGYLEDPRFNKADVIMLLKVQYECFDSLGRGLDALEVGARLFVLQEIDFYEKINHLDFDEDEINFNIKDAFLNEERFSDEELMDRYLIFIESIHDEDAMVDYLMDNPLKISRYIHNISEERLPQIVAILERAIEEACSTGKNNIEAYLAMYREYCGNINTEQLLNTLKLKYGYAEI